MPKPHGPTGQPPRIAAFHPPLTFAPQDMSPADWAAYLAKLDATQKQAAYHQDAWLCAYVECGNVTDACQAIGITRHSVGYWVKTDLNRFRDRYEVARLGYCDHLESEAHHRIKAPEGNRGGDILLMAMLNANLPQKYTRDKYVVADTGLKEFLTELRALGQRQPKAIEAEVTEVAPEVQIAKRLTEGAKEEKP